ncbi:hypothetical protein HK103_004205 [Boothiomyces macroporosus]|uniref:Putative 2'-deoxynucleoside 5'-phosphate N-hydrolase 1 n=1 Tax=Boothiomyces macroporosus TaxID=261099 RepID=A0AAD5Y3M3_9FUNG|nr:hypothetical protein HK103_004205 [Boothiomyces macroporosus]
MQTNDQSQKPHKKEPEPKRKIVIRRLPPSLPEDVFKNSVEKWLDKLSHYEFFPGKLAKSQNKESVYTRAYFAFEDLNFLLEFCKSYNGHTFIDSKGNQFRAVVEFAPFQKVIDPSKKKKADARMNTIHEDPEYLEFLESLKKEPAAETVDVNDVEYLMSNPSHQPKLTPLIESIKAKKESKLRKKKMKEVKLLARDNSKSQSNQKSRNESHSKDFSQQSAGQHENSQKGDKSKSGKEKSTDGKKRRNRKKEPSSDPKRDQSQEKPKGGTQDAALYQQLISHLKQYGPVLTEHVGDPTRTAQMNLSDSEIWKLDMKWLRESTIVIAECTVTSLGVGYELGIAESLKLPTLCLYRGQQKHLSAMITGNPNFTTSYYLEVAEAIELIDRFMVEKTLIKKSC